MCGIVGVANGKGIRDRALLGIACQTLSHRGPDDTGEWWSGDSAVGLAFKRLAIIDLSPGGHQPMSDAREELNLVFNGEIYNYKELRETLRAKGHSFRTESDTEVVLGSYREWGEACLQRFNGMFALAIYDTRTRSVFLARDRAGEKPLFYSIRNGTLQFASELKALMADPGLPRRIDPDSLDCYLSMGFVPGDRCILEGVNKLPPAHSMTFDLASGTASVRRYWQLPEYFGPSTIADESVLLDELESLLEDAVSRQMVADVPLGILLSGGVDSSLVTAMAARAATDVKTFTVRFPGDPALDETSHARMIASHFGTHHLEVVADEVTTDLLPKLARQFDEPMSDSSMLPTYLVTKLIRAHCTVALGGDGGDELFGGYFSHSRVAWLRKWVGPVPHLLRAPVAAAAERFLPTGMRGRTFLQAAGADFDSDLPDFTAHFTPRARRLLLGSGAGTKPAAESVRRGRLPAKGDAVDRITRADFENYLPEDILVKVDRTSMLNSLEVRAPMLDYRVVEFAFGSIPAGSKATSGARKIFLKKLCERVLPAGFDMRRKQGLDVPLARWLRSESGEWRAFFSDVLLTSDDSPFDKTIVRSLMRGQTKGRSNSERLFMLALFELWRREYKVQV